MDSSATQNSSLKTSAIAGITTFFTMAYISITRRILWGFISRVGLYLMAGRPRDIHSVMYALALVSIGLLVLERVKFG